MSEATTPKLNLFISLPDHYDLLEMVCPEIKFSADPMIKLDYSLEELAKIRTDPVLFREWQQELCNLDAFFL